MSQNNTQILYVGLDVAKLSLELHLTGPLHTLANDAKGHAQILKLVRRHPPAHDVCKATGGYEQPVVRTLHAARDLATRDKYQFQWWAVSRVVEGNYPMDSYTREEKCLRPKSRCYAQQNHFVSLP